MFIGLYKDKLNITQIAKTLHKSSSNITRELPREKDKEGIYNPVIAEKCHAMRRKNQKLILKVDYNNLREAIKEPHEL